MSRCCLMVPLLTVTEVCKELRTSRDTFYRLVKTKKLRLVKVGRLSRISRADLDRFIAAEPSAPRRTRTLARPRDCAPNGIAGRGDAGGSQ